MTSYTMRGSARNAVSNNQKTVMVLLGICVGYLAGYILMETADVIFSSGGSLVHFHGGRELAAAVKGPKNTVHTIFTCGGDAYQNYQARIMYGTYKIVQRMPGGEALTGFTRILHRMTTDVLVHEMPTFQAIPLHPECDSWCEFPVADRPDAVQQWFNAVDKNPALLKGDWVMLIECDYVWMKPLQAPDASDPNQPGLQFDFDYIMPNHPVCRKIIRKLSGGRDPKTVPTSGPAPVLLRFEDWKRITPKWMELTAAIEADPAAVKALEWIREMYAWDVAVLLTPDVKILTVAPPNSTLIAQPPHDLTMGEAAMCHYTWGAIYKDNGTDIWRWDKRDFTQPENVRKILPIAMPPPWCAGLKLQDGFDVGQNMHNTLAAMLAQMNRAIETLPDLSQPLEE